MKPLFAVEYSLKWCVMAQAMFSIVIKMGLQTKIAMYSWSLEGGGVWELKSKDWKLNNNT